MLDNAVQSNAVGGVTLLRYASAPVLSRLQSTGEQGSETEAEAWAQHEWLLKRRKDGVCPCVPYQLCCASACP